MMDADGKVTVSKRVSGDQNGDATVFGSVLNKHSRRLFELMQCPEVSLRSLALDLTGVALRQGLLNPNEVVPYLFALQGDIDNTEIRSLALRLLIAEGEKRPDVLRQRMRAGVEEAYNFQRRIHPDSLASAIVRDDGQRRCIFSQIFEKSIVQNRKLREGLYKSLLKLFEHDRSAVGQRDGVDVPLLSFVSEVLASLPYQSITDPLFLIHYISDIISLQGQQMRDRFADFLRPHGLANKDEFDDTIAEEDLLEIIARNKLPLRSEEAKVLASAEFNMDHFGRLCQEGFLLVLLIRLKTFLRSRYNLSSARCLEFDPNAKERPSDKVLGKANVLKDFDLCRSIDKVSFDDGDSIIRQYALFRRCLREEHLLSNDNSVDESLELPGEKSRKLSPPNNEKAQKLEPDCKHSLIGKKVAKYFKNEHQEDQLYPGEVVAYIPSEEVQTGVDLWRIQFDDGDKEDVEYNEALSIIAQYKENCRLFLE